VAGGRQGESTNDRISDIVRAAAERLNRVREAIETLAGISSAPAPVFVPVRVRRPRPAPRQRW
jgi:hypothetical protein